MLGYKSLRLSGMLCALGLIFALAVQPAPAGPLYFDSTAGTTWDNATTMVWANSPSGSYTLSWADSSDAHFEGTAGTVTVAENIAAVNSLNFDVSGYTLNSGTLTLTGSGGITINSGNATIGSVLSGTVGFTKYGAGTLTLNTLGNFTGPAIVADGTLVAGTDNVVPTTGTLILGDSAANTSGIYDLNTGAATLAGLLTAGSGTANQVINSSASITGGLNLNISGTNIFSGRLGGGASGNNFNLTKSGTGTLTLGSANTFTGGTSVAAGTLKLANSLALQNSTLTGGSLAFDSSVGSHAFTLGGLGGAGNIPLTDGTNAVLLTVGNNNANTTYSGVLSVSGGSLVKIGTGSLVLTGSNTYGGGTTVSQGTLQIGNGAVNGAMTGTSYAIANGAKLFLNQGASPASPTWSYFTGSGTLELSDAATSSSVNYNQLALSPGFTGTLQIDNRGRIHGTPANLGGTSALVLTGSAQFLAYDGTAGGTSYTYTQSLSLAGSGSETSQTYGAIRVSGMNANFAGNVTLTGNAGLYAQNNAGTTLTVSGNIGGGYALAINNYFTNPITLSGSNTYTGGTQVNNGTLVISNTNAVPATGTIRVNSAGVLYATGAYSPGGWLTSGKLDTGSSGVLALTANTADNLDFSQNGGYGGLYLGSTGSFTASGTVTPAASGFRLGGGGGTLTISGSLGGTTNGAVFNGTTYLAGTAANTYTGTSVINNGSVYLSKTGGATAIASGGTVQLGGGNANQPNLRMQQNNQFGDGVVMTFANASGNWARFDLAATGQTLAGLVAGNATTQAGAVIQNVGTDGVGAGTGTLTLNGTGSYLYNGFLRDADNNATTNKLALVKSGTGVQTLCGNQLTYTGPTTISGGTLAIGTGGSLPNTIAINIGPGAMLNLGGSANNQIQSGLNGPSSLVVSGTLAATTAFANTMYPGTIILNNGTMTSTGGAPGDFGAFYVGANRTITANGASNVISGNGKLGISSGNTLTLSTPLASDALAVSAVVGIGANGTAGGLAKSGLGTVTLTSANAYTGATTAGGGTLKLDFSAAGAPASNILYNGVTAGGLTLGGGALAVMGSASGTTTQGFGALTFQGGGSLVVGNSGANTTLTLASLTRNGGALAIDRSAGAGTNNVAFTSTAGIPATGAIGWAIVTDSTGTGFGTLSGNNIVRYTPSTTVLDNASNSSGTDYTTGPTDPAYTGGLLTMNVGAHALNTLAIDTASSAGTLDLAGNTGASAMSLTSSGVMMTGGNNYTIRNGQLGATGAETDIHVLGSGALTVAGLVGSGASTLAKGGPGLLVLTGSNVYTGQTSIAGGTLQIANGGRLNAGAYAGNIYLGGTLAYTSSLNQTLSGNLFGVGPLYKSATSALTLSGSNTNYTGTVTISQGTVNLSGANASGSNTSIVVGDAGSGATTPTLRVTNAQPNVGSLTVGFSGSNIIVDNSSAGATTGPTINGVTTLNTPLTFTYVRSGSQWLYTTIKQKITGSGGGSGNDTLIFKQSGGSGNPYWQYDGAVPNDFLGNVHVVTGNWATQNFGNPGGNVMIPDAAMMIIDSGATWTWNNQSATLVETIDGLAGAGTMNKNASNYTLTINANNSDNEGKRSFSGVFSGMLGTLTFGGTGTQEFRGATPNFTNAMALNNGRLKLNYTTGWNSNIAFGNVAVNNMVLELASTSAGEGWTFGKQLTGGATSASIVKTGTGTVTLQPAAASTFIGSTTGALTVNQGTLRLASSFSTAPAVYVAGGATFAGLSTAGTTFVAANGNLQGGLDTTGTQSLTLSSLTFGGAVNLSGALGTATPFVINGAVTTAGANTVNITAIPPTPATAGVYHYLKYTSLPSGEGFGAFKFATPVRSMTLVNTAGYVDINYNPANYPIWTGTNSSTFVGGNNWKLSSDGSQTDFLGSDAAVLDDTAAGSTNITVDSQVAPGSLTFNNSSLAYSLTNTGTGAITAGNLIKNGTGLLTISGNNTFNGSVALNGGTVAISAIANSGAAQPLGSGGAVNFNGGTLQYTGASASTNGAMAVGTSGAGFRIDTVGATLTLATVPTGTGAITKTGAGGLNLPNGTYAQPIAVNGGTLGIAGGNFNGAISGNGVITINNGSTYVNFGSGTGDTTPNTFNGETYTYGYHIVFNKAANTPAIGGNVHFKTGYWAYFDSYPVSENVFAAGTVLNFETTNSTLFEFHMNGKNQTLAGINCSNTYAIFENGGHEGGNQTGLPAVTLTLNGTGSYAYNGSLRDQNGGSNGALSVVKQGTGTQVLERDASYTGSTTISGGVLRFNATGFTTLPTGSMTLNGGVLEMQAPSTMTRTLGSAGGQVQITGGTTGFSAYGTPITVTLNNSSAVEVQWNSTYFSPNALVLNAVTANNTITFQNPLDLNGAQRTVLVNSSTATISGVIRDSVGFGGGLSKGGSGTLVLTAGNSYAGATTVNAGTLYVNGSLASASAVTVAGGATLGGRGTAGDVAVNAGGAIEGGQGGTGSLTLSSLSFTDSATVNITPAADPYVPISAAGGLTTGTGTVWINLAGSTLPAGTYHLIQDSGSILGTGSSAFQLGTYAAPAHGSYTLLENPGYLDLSVFVDSLIWTASASNSWDTTTRLPGTTNWYLQTGSTAADFVANDSVIFNDTAAQTNVDISNGNVTPASVTFNNTLSYTLSGANGIAGAATLTKSGSGLLTISNTNAFSGAATVGGGTVAIGSASGLGAGTVLNLGNSATLQYTGAASANSTRGLVLDSGDAVVQVDNAGVSLGLNGPMTGSSPLLKTGLGGLTLGGPSGSTYGGAITISQGTLTFNSATAANNGASVTLGDANTGANPVTMLIGSGINNPVYLANIYNSNYGTSQTIVLNGGSSLGDNNQDLVGTLNLSGSVPVTVRATNTNGHGTRQDWRTRIAGSGIPAGSTALTIDGSTYPIRMTFTASNANSFTGDVLMQGNVSTQGETYLGAVAANQNLGFLNNNVTVASGATWIVVWGGETVAGLNGSGTINLNNQNALNNIGLTVGNTDASGSFSGGITGGFGLAKTGTGTQVLGSLTGVTTATSTFTGGITINGGKLIAAAVRNGTSTPLGLASNTRTITVNAGGTLEFAAPNTFGGHNATTAPTLAISGGTVTNADPVPTDAVNNSLNNVTLTNGVLTSTVGNHSGYAAWNINGTITSSGNSLISTSDPVYGTVMLNSSAGSAGTTTVNVVNGTLAVETPLVQNNVDSVVSSLAKSGSGVMVLTASNTYTGATTVNGGTLQLGDGTSGRDGSIQGNVTDNAALVYNLFGSQTAGYAIGGSGTVSKTGPGMLTLTGGNSHGGGTTVNGGTLQLGNATALGTGGLTANSGVVDLNGYTLNLAGSNALAWLAGTAGTVTDHAAAGTTTLGVNQFMDTTFAGSIQPGAGGRNIALQKHGAGSLTLSGTSTVAGASVFNSGALKISGSLAAAGGSVNNTATLQVDGTLTSTNDLSVNGGQLAGNGTINLMGGAGLYVASATPFTFTGTLAGTKGVEIDNGAHLTLTGANTYADGTLIDAGGTLSVNNAAGSGTGTGLVTVNGLLMGSGSIAGNVSVGAGGTVAPGNSIGTLTVGGSLNLAGLSYFEINTSTMTNDQVTGIGSLSYGGSLQVANLGVAAYSSTQSWDLFDFTSGSQSGSFANNSVFGTHGDGVYLPNLGSSLNWDFNYATGVLSIVNAFNGAGIWTSSSGSAWNNAAHWLDGGIPGIAPRPDNTDSATFSGSGSVTSVDLTGENPSLKTMNFSASDYTLSGGSLTLKSDTGTATVTVSAGTQTIASLLTLASSANIVPAAGTTLILSGDINGSGALSLTDSGTLILSGTNGYTGGTFVAAGVLLVQNASALLDGSSLTIGDAGAFPAPVVPPPAAPVLAGSLPAGVHPVPEPGTLGLLLACLAGAAVYRTVRRRRAA